MRDEGRLFLLSQLHKSQSLFSYDGHFYHAFTRRDYSIQPTGGGATAEAASTQLDIRTVGGATNSALLLQHAASLAAVMIRAPQSNNHALVSFLVFVAVKIPSPCLLI